MNNPSEWGASGGPGKKPQGTGGPSGPGKGSAGTSMPNPTGQVSGAIREGAREVKDKPRMSPRAPRTLRPRPGKNW
jgi:hypothetical protein